MTSRQMFKFAFIQRCQEAGYRTPEAICALVKRAVLGGLTQSFLELAKPVVEIGGGVALGLPVIAGIGAGRMAGEAVNASETTQTPDDVKRTELLNEYARQAAYLRRQGELRRQGLIGNA